MSGYADDQYEGNYPDGIQDHYWIKGRNQIVYRLLMHFGNNESTLDIGCGRGVMVKYLRDRGVEAWGCEIATPKPLTRDIAPYLMLGQDALEISGSQAKQVRQLLMLDVLEHVEHPREFMLRCIDKFGNAQRLLLTLPARQELWSNYDERYGHQKRYSKAEAAELVDGFDILELDYFFHALYPAARLLSRLSIDRQENVKPPARKAAKLAHRMLARAFDIEARVLPGGLFGTSLYVFIEL